MTDPATEDATRPGRKSSASPGGAIKAILDLLASLGFTGIKRIFHKPKAKGGVTAHSAQERKAELVALGSRLGASNAAHQARRAFAGSAERKAELDEQHTLRTAADVAAALGGMKGVLMKVAQMQSFLNDDLPDAWKQALAQLQADAPPMSGELAAEVIAGDLGVPPETLFAEWDPMPIAAASVGQVHRAMTKDDRAVAVKVQYPGAAEALSSDMDNLALFLDMATKQAEQNPEAQAAKAEPELDLEPLVAEIRARITEEVDYRNEAANQNLFASYFAGHPFIAVPKLVPELSGERVITTELVDAVRFAEFETWSQEERDLAGETIFRFVYHSIFRLGAYNGDPHPGNYLFEPGGKVTFLDFGLVKKVDPESTEVLGKVFELGVVDQDPAGFRKAMEAAGFLKTDAEVSDQLVYDQMARPWHSLLADEVTAMPFPETDMQRQRRTPTDEDQAMAKAFDLPTTFLLLMRTLVGMQALLARLGARANWRRIAEEIWPFVEGAASTPQGVAEQEWRQGHPRLSGR